MFSLVPEEPGTPSWRGDSYAHRHLAGVKAYSPVRCGGWTPCQRDGTLPSPPDFIPPLPALHPCPRPLLTCFLSLEVSLHFQGFHVEKWYSMCLWLAVSLSTTETFSIYQSFILSMLSTTHHGGIPRFGYHSPVDRHLGSPQFGKTMNKVPETAGFPRWLRRSGWPTVSPVLGAECLSFIYPHGAEELDSFLILVCIFLVTSDLEQLFLCSLATITLLSRSACSNFLPIF